jgi:ribulose-5-phosphate 4-epimerase/fuculose-1-phosphate aldolase
MQIHTQIYANVDEVNEIFRSTGDYLTSWFFDLLRLRAIHMHCIVSFFRSNRDMMIQEEE